MSTSATNTKLSNEKHVKQLEKSNLKSNITEPTYSIHARKLVKRSDFLKIFGNKTVVMASLARVGDLPPHWRCDWRDGDSSSQDDVSIIYLFGGRSVRQLHSQSERERQRKRKKETERTGGSKEEERDEGGSRICAVRRPERGNQNDLVITLLKNFVNMLNQTSPLILNECLHRQF